MTSRAARALAEDAMDFPPASREGMEELKAMAVDITRAYVTLVREGLRGQGRDEALEEFLAIALEMAAEACARIGVRLRDMEEDGTEYFIDETPRGGMRWTTP